MSSLGEEPREGCPSDEELELAALASCPWDIKEHAQTCAKCSARLLELEHEAELIREIAGAVGSGDAQHRAGKSDGIEGYKRLAEIYRGGQGVVYKAIQIDTNRVVALKALKSGHFATREERARFQREIELVARLKHPGIVTVFGSGTADTGERYIAMEYIEGERLDRFAGARWGKSPEWNAKTLREFALLFVDLCDAAAHAQQRGIIHRDLKPSNVLVDENGSPRVLDFGIARESDADEAAQLTQGHEFVGTYAYAAPEQFRGGGSAIGTWTDVYAIGVMAYEVLTGARPHTWTGSLPDLTRAVCEDDAADPSLINASISRDIATIVLKALAIDPERRYQSAAALRDEFRRAATGEPIDARRDNTVYVLKRIASKYRWRVASAALVLFILLVAAPLATYLAIEANYKANEAIVSFNLILKPLEKIDREASVTGSISTLTEFLAEVSELSDRDLREYPVLTTTVNSALGLAYLDQNKYEQALTHMQRALELRARTLDPPHLDLAQTHHNLGRIYWKAARYEESRFHYDRALNMFTELLGANHPRTADTAQQFASTLTFLNEFELAETLLRSTLKTNIEQYGAEDPRVALSWFTLGRFFQEQGETREALECLSRALEMIEADAGPDDFRVGRALHFLAITLIDMGDQEKARAIIARAVLNKKALFGTEHRELAVTELLFARTILRGPSPNEAALRNAVSIASRAKNVLEQAYDTDQPETATAYALLGEALLRLGRLDDARQNLERSLAIREAALPEGSWPIGESAMLLAECLALQAEHAHAAPLAERALDILSRSRRPEDQLRLRAEALERSLH